MRLKSVIAGVGHFVPENIVTNHDLTKLMDTSDEWIVERTGINERRYAIKGEETTASMGAKAAKKAISNAGLSVDDIDFIVFATISSDYLFPGCGVLVQELLGCRNIGALDVRNQCSGFIYALSVADKFIQSNTYKNILVIGSEIHSFGLDMTTRGRSVSVIFGDGAGAVVLSATADESRGILSTHLHSEGKHAKELTLAVPGTATYWVDRMLEPDYEPNLEEIYPYMNGNFIFKHAVTRFQEVINEALTANQKTVKDLDLFIPHQANLRISQYIQKVMKLRDDQVFNNIMHYGNTTAATIPIALSEAYANGRIKEGDLVCLAAFGSGFTWGSILLNW